MISSEAKPVWQHLRQADGGSVVLHTKDGDDFCMPIDEVVKACRSQEEIDQFCQQVGALLERLSRWLIDRKPEIQAAYMGLEPDGAIFLVVRKAKAFDPAFEDALSLLDLEIAQNDDFNLIKLRVLALPSSSEQTIASFLDIKNTFRYTVGHAPS
jgi:hypothetical protein